MSSIEIVEDNTDEFGSELKRAIARGLEKVGQVAEGYAKRICPVDTGRLRNSITHAMEGSEAVVIGTNVEYGPAVELGTSRQKAQPFLRPAATDHVDQYRSILEGEIRGR